MLLGNLTCEVVNTACNRMTLTKDSLCHALCMPLGVYNFAGSEHPSQSRLDKSGNESSSDARQGAAPSQPPSSAASSAPRGTSSGNGDAPAMPSQPRKAAVSDAEGANTRMWMSNGAQPNASMGMDYLSSRYQGMSVSGGPPESSGGVQRTPSQDGNAWGVQQRSSAATPPQAAWGMRPQQGAPPPPFPSYSLAEPWSSSACAWAQRGEEGEPSAGRGAEQERKGCRAVGERGRAGHCSSNTSKHGRGGKSGSTPGMTTLRTCAFCCPSDCRSTRQGFDSQGGTRCSTPRRSCVGVGQGGGRRQLA